MVSSYINIYKNFYLVLLHAMFLAMCVIRLLIVHTCVSMQTSSYSQWLNNYSGGHGQLKFPAGVSYTCYQGGTCSGLTITTSGVTTDPAALNPCCFSNNNNSKPIIDGAYIADGSVCQKCAS